MSAQQATQIGQQATRYAFDLSHTSAEFSVKHLMIATVRGRLPVKGGFVEHDPTHPERTRIVAELDAAGISTGQGDRDAHLRSADFLDAGTFPTIRFESTRVEKLASGAWQVAGELTIRGVAQPVVLEVEHEGEAKDPWGKTHVGLTGRTTIDRARWGLAWNQALETGGVLVGDKVKVELHVELLEERS
jgi:polyisoprenoid-binding protein YceI